MNGIVILGCGASFRSRSPHFFFFFLPGDSPSFVFDNVAHMWLMPINITARGQTPGDRRGGGFWPPPAWCLHREKKKKRRCRFLSHSSSQLDLSNTHNQRQTQLQSVGFLWDQQKAPLVLTLLKVCHIILIISYLNSCKSWSRGGTHVNLWGGNVSHAFPWENQG